MSTLTANPNNAFQKNMIWLWELMDISDNLKKAELEARKVGDGFVNSGIHFFAMIMLTVVTAALAWHFDFESTLVGMSTLREVVLPGLPASVATFSIYIAFALTIAPTLIEMFTAAYARADIKILQLFVIGFTTFDAITDIPRAKAFTDQLQANFDQLGAFAGLGYWTFFLFWLFLSTIGFELAMVIFAYLAVTFFIKMLKPASVGYVNKNSKPINNQSVVVTSNKEKTSDYVDTKLKEVL